MKKSGKMSGGALKGVEAAMGKYHETPKLKFTTHQAAGKRATTHLTHGPSSKKKS